LLDHGGSLLSWSEITVLLEDCDLTLHENYLLVLLDALVFKLFLVDIEV
jgi:hypothetical protein